MIQRTTRKVDVMWEVGMPWWLLWLLAVGMLFFLARPPVLLFWHHELGASVAPDPVSGETPTVAARQGAAGLPPPPPAPALPAVLRQPPQPLPVIALPLTRLAEAVETAASQARTGLPSFVNDDRLRIIAQRHALEMVRENYLDIVSPQGISPALRGFHELRDVFGQVSELVGRVSGPVAEEQALDLVQSWVNHPVHRRVLRTDGELLAGAGCAEQQSTGKEVFILCSLVFLSPVLEVVEPVPLTFGKGEKVRVQVQPVAGRADPLQLQLINPNVGGGIETTVAFEKIGDIWQAEMPIKGAAGTMALAAILKDDPHALRPLDGPLLVRR